MVSQDDIERNVIKYGTEPLYNSQKEKEKKYKYHIGFEDEFELGYHFAMMDLATHNGMYMSSDLTSQKIAILREIALANANQQAKKQKKQKKPNSANSANKDENQTQLHEMVPT